MTSSTVDSNANSAGSRLGSLTIAGSSVRTHADSGGVDIPAAAASATSTAGGVLDGASPVMTSAERRHGGAGDEHRRLTAPVDEPSEQRGGDRAGDRVSAADRAGDGERAGQLLSVDEQRDAEHREREASEDRASEQRACSGGREDRGV